MPSPSMLPVWHAGRWHFYTAPGTWKPSEREELEEEDKLTTAPMESLHPDMHSEKLSTRFRDLSDRRKVKCCVEVMYMHQ